MEDKNCKNFQYWKFSERLRKHTSICFMKTYSVTRFYVKTDIQTLEDIFPHSTYVNLALTVPFLLLRVNNYEKPENEITVLKSKIEHSKSIIVKVKCWGMRLNTSRAQFHVILNISEKMKYLLICIWNKDIECLQKINEMEWNIYCKYTFQ